MHTERMTVKERMMWYTEFIEEASKLGSVDRTILQRKKVSLKCFAWELQAMIRRVVPWPIWLFRNATRRWVGH